MLRSNRKAQAFLAAIAVLWIGGCGKSDAGPKTIRADGKDYVACGGVVTLQSPDGPKDMASGTQDVMFEDPQGVKRVLSRVRSLTITPYPGDPNICNGHQGTK